MPSQQVVTAIVSLASVLIGIIVGHVLSRSWQRKQWILEARKQECRELLTAIAEHHNALLRPQRLLVSGEMQESYEKESMRVIDNAHSKAVATIRDRIYIANDVKQADIFKRWIDAFTNFRRTRDASVFTREFEAISETIIKAAMKGV